MMTILALAAAAIASPQPVDGVWHNPSNSVAVRMAPCTERGEATLCGWVVRASAQAQADAHGGGAPRLVGARLLSDYRAAGRNRWSGTLYVPDMGRTVGSTITLVDPATLTVKGCLIGAFLCKAQTWRRD